jgi:hypothetical protein
MKAIWKWLGTPSKSSLQSQITNLIADVADFAKTAGKEVRQINQRLDALEAKALRAAQVQPVQEADVFDDDIEVTGTTTIRTRYRLEVGTKLYTTPPAQLAPVPLTDEQIDRAVYTLTGFDGDGTQALTIDEIRRIARATFLLATPPAAAVQQQKLERE